MTPPIPSALADLTPEWLTHALRAGGALGDVTVARAGVTSIGRGTGLLCQLARIELDYAQAPSHAPRTLVAKLATDDEGTRGMVALFRFYEREVRFYEELAGSLPIATPRCYASAFDDARGDFTLLLEDLGHLRAADQLAPGSPADAERVTDALVRLHARYWDDAAIRALPWLLPADCEINKMGLGLYVQAWPVFLERLGDVLPAAAIDIGERLGPRAVPLLEALATSPHTVCHGDVRLDNVFFARDDGAPTLLDWQIAGRGVGTYDLAYFMSQSLDADVRRGCERAILRRYHAGLLDAGVRGYDFAQCELDYRRAALFGFVYPVIGGGLGDVANERGHTLARVMAERSAAAILDWDAAELLSA